MTQGLTQETAEAVQRALGTEHAALWAYGLVSAFLPAGFDTAVQEGTLEHRGRRDAVSRMLNAAKIAPAPAEPAYLPPKPVTDQATALSLLVQVEGDGSVAWRAVLERCDDAETRKVALTALTETAVRGTRWRKAAGLAPLVPAMPGM